MTSLKRRHLGLAGAVKDDVLGLESEAEGVHGLGDGGSLGSEALLPGRGHDAADRVRLESHRVEHEGLGESGLDLERTDLLCKRMQAAEDEQINIIIIPSISWNHIPIFIVPSVLRLKFYSYLMFVIIPILSMILPRSVKLDRRFLIARHSKGKKKRGRGRFQ